MDRPSGNMKTYTVLRTKHFEVIGLHLPNISHVKHRAYLNDNMVRHNQIIPCSTHIVEEI